MFISLRNHLLQLSRFYLKALSTSELVKNIFKVYLGDITSKFIAAGSIVILIRGLSVGDFAQYTAYYSVMLLFAYLIGSGINQAQVTYTAEYMSTQHRKPLEIYVVSFIFQLVLYLLVCALVFCLADKFTTLLFGNHPYQTAMKYGLVAGFGFLLTNAGSSVFQSEERFSTYVKISWFRQIIIFLTVTSLLLSHQLSFTSAVVSLVTVELIVGIIITYFAFMAAKKIHLLAYFQQNRQLLKKFLFSSFWLIGYFGAINLSNQLNIFMLSHFSTPLQLANYGVAYRYYSLAILILNSMNAVLLVRFSKSDLNDHQAIKQLISQWFKALAWTIIPILIIDMLGRSVFLWVNGPQYGESYNLFIILTIGVWLSLLLSPFINILSAKKKFRFIFFSATVALIINFIGSLILIPLWGGIGAAIMAVIANNFILQMLVFTRLQYKIN